jgi:hypothetical protein
MRRKWAERIVIVLAALASIATSPARWRVEATPPPPVAGKAMVVTIEASQRPEVSIQTQSGSRPLVPTEEGSAPGEPQTSSQWPGTGRYFVPAGARLERIEINGRCSGKLCSGKCTAPATVHVVVTSVKVVEGWIAESRSDPVTTVLDGGKPSPKYQVTVESSRRPVTLEIQGAPERLRPSIWQSHSGKTVTFHLTWYESNGQAEPVTVTWSARATIQGECPGAGACGVPAEEGVRVVAVEPEAPDRP